MVTGEAPSLPAWAAAYNQDRPLHNKAILSVCYAPYVTLDFAPNGDVFVCCVNTKYQVGHVTEQTILDIWRGARIRTLRERLKQFDFSLHCERCRWQVDLGNFSSVFAKRDDGFTVPHDPPEFPQRMDFRLSNACNFACTMCNGDYSSILRAKEGRAPFARVYGERFFEQLSGCLPHLKEARFAGGEPFLIPEYSRIWDLMIAQGATVRCMLNTNASILNDRVHAYLERIPFYNIGISVDGATRETFEAIRYGGNFEQVLRHAAVIKSIADRKRTKVHFAVCVMRQNWREFPEIVRLAEQLGCPVNVNLVYHPTACSLYELPREELTAVRLYLERALERLRPTLFSETVAHWQALLESLVATELKDVGRPLAHQALPVTT